MLELMCEFKMLSWVDLAYMGYTYSLHDILSLLIVLSQCGIGVGIFLFHGFHELTDIRLFMYTTIMHY